MSENGDDSFVGLNRCASFTGSESLLFGHIWYLNPYPNRAERQIVPCIAFEWRRLRHILAQISACSRTARPTLEKSFAQQL
jgi:hypothetical protein